MSFIHMHVTPLSRLFCCGVLGLVPIVRRVDAHPHDRSSAPSVPLHTARTRYPARQSSAEFGSAITSLASSIPAIAIPPRASHSAYDLRLSQGTSHRPTQRRAHASQKPYEQKRIRVVDVQTPSQHVSRAAPALPPSSPRPQRPGRQYKPHGHHALHEGLAGVPGLAGQAAGQTQCPGSSAAMALVG